MVEPKKRLDVLLVERGLAATRTQAQAFVLAGVVWTKEVRLEKPGMEVKSSLPLEVRSRTPAFSSRAGHKLEHALSAFEIQVVDRVCLDVGASTGGFTDCLLKEGAKFVFAVDVGHGQLDSRLAQDPRVANVEKANARYLQYADLAAHSALAEQISLAVLDVSFISLKLLVEPLAQSFPTIRDWIFLFKPQFEVGREHVGKGGLVKDLEVIQQSLESFDTFLTGKKFSRRHGPESSPLPGKKSGNVEYLVHYELHA